MLISYILSLLSLKILIVAKCIVNHPPHSQEKMPKMILIVAKCIVNEPYKFNIRICFGY